MGVLKDRLKADLVTAMKARDEAAKSNLRMAIAAIGVEEVAGASARELSEAEEIGVLTKEVSKRRDSAEAYAAGGRPELAEKENSEAEFLSQYLPAPLTEDELDQIVAEEVAAAEASLGEKPGMKQMGQVVKAVNTRVAGRAPGAQVAAKVRASLT
ncbi:GatB/YqeY domain-containing protein [Aestuariimicrobium sp. p3-SID1156]|uniref:GatB/YqeY domain-containing protein n=1 Tax=Aestuariimicrobium sp. p3-SID1156 TaxID=2916038 RepID=UPI00223B17B9|nr:GatB/YqeY domain-containing protein [Aestuariimicrobium sp. p3-SID1156]MCT1459943.1 GatB/YqeY domain-containing protein [Aestuariimicrobium sp. p3-SID1156]